MALIIPIQPVPNQKLSVNIGNKNYVIILTTRDSYKSLSTLKDDTPTDDYDKNIGFDHVGQILYFDLLQNNSYIVAGAKVGQLPIILYPSIINQIGGNFKMVTLGQDDEGNNPVSVLRSNNGNPVYYSNFGITQFLAYYSNEENISG